MGTPVKGKDRPIIFSGPMVRALLEGRKTQTRRLFKEKAGQRLSATPRAWEQHYSVGDRLWVRETTRAEPLPNILTGEPTNAIVAVYDSDNEWVCDCAGFNFAKWWNGKGKCSAIHMPRWASRLILTVTDVRVQRLQDISEEDARAEGVKPSHGQREPFTASFADMWNELHGSLAWAENPWVVAITFAVHHANIDALKQEVSDAAYSHGRRSQTAQHG